MPRAATVALALDTTVFCDEAAAITVSEAAMTERPPCIFEGLAEVVSAMLGIALGELDEIVLGDVDGVSDGIFEGV